MGIISDYPDSLGGFIVTENVTSCPLCESTSVSDWCIGSDRIYEQHNNKFSYSLCKGCSTVFESKRPLESEIHKVYPIEYAPHQTKQNKPKHKSINKFILGFATRLVGQKSFQNIIEKHVVDLGSSHVVLDYGCGAGKFLNKMSAKGCSTIGVDFSSGAIEIIKSNGHEAHLVSDTLWETLIDESIDFIRLNHVVEHLYQPKDVIRNLLCKLKPGGKIHIAVPNPSGISAKIFRSLWYGLECPRHVIMSPPETLKLVLYDIGFEFIKLYQEPQSKDHIRSWGYLAETLGIIDRTKVDSLIYSGALQLLMALPCRIASLLGFADRYHLVASKPI